MRSELRDRGGKTALVVIDVQNGVVADGWDTDGVISRIATLVEAAREGGTPVVYIQHETPGFDDLEVGSDAWRIHEMIGPAAGDAVVAKRHADAFIETTLEDTLADLGVGHLLLTGAQSDACVRSTSYGALRAGYDITLVSDAHTTSDRPHGDSVIPAELIIAHLNLANQFIDYPETVSRVIPHSAVADELTAVVTT
jgi:nicotinamidase-related amidase